MSNTYEYFFSDGRKIYEYTQTHSVLGEIVVTRAG